jgi:hypothetical protein
LKRLPIGDRPLNPVKFLYSGLRFLVIIPEVGTLGILVEFGGLIAKPVDLKDTPEVFRGAI